MLKKEYPKNKPVCKVAFTLPETIKAENARLVGDFNNWDANKTTMKKVAGGRFTVTLELKKGCEYQFRYLINGSEWYNDPQADKYVASPFGTDNSVVTP
jgi:1,4-alpha-glucan branching enzyme